MKTFRTVLVCSTAAATVLALGTGVANASPRSRSHPSNNTRTLYVSKRANSRYRGRSCSTATFSSINAAIAAAGVGQTISVCPGTYHEAVVVPKTVRLEGNRAVVDAAGAVDAQGIPVPGITISASRVEVSGFTVENSTAEGILATTIPGLPALTGLNINRNLVKHNDLGDPGTPDSPYAQCRVTDMVPGDCGEALHLMGVINSSVRYNDVTGNSGGILLSDETGPNHGNLVANNRVHNNLLDCGITLPSHVAGNGVYGNTVRSNIITGNGGAGVQLAAAGPGMASHDNLVTGNFIEGNGHVGVTIHAHAPGQNVSGNRIIGNWIARNNLTGDSTGVDNLTTGVLVYSAVVPVTVTIRSNLITDNTYGVWLGSNVRSNAVAQSNAFFRVSQKVHVGS